MQRFTYTAENGTGEVYRGVAEVRDKSELFQVIRREGGTLISLQEDNVGNVWSFSYWNKLFSTIPAQEKIVFARNLGAMLTAGLSLARALAVLERQSKNAKLKDVLSQVASGVRRGEQLHVILAKYPSMFSELFVAMVRAGEESGTLPTALKGIAEQMDRADTLKKKVRGALIYPSIIVVAIIGIGALMMTQVVPTLAQTFEELGTDLPASTRAIIAVSDFLVDHTFLALVLVGALGLGLYAAMQTRIGRRGRDFLFVHMPVIGELVKEVNAARTARTMTSLLSAGVDMLTALEITGEVVQNTYFREVLAKARADVQRGGQLSKQFAAHEDLYPALVGEMVSVGEETGALAEMLERLATFYEDEVSRKTKDMSTIIEPFLMLIIGAGVGFFAISMISPIYSLSESI